MRTSPILLVLIALSTALLGVPGSAQAQVRGAGATFPEPIYAKWFAEFKGAAGVSVDYQAVGSGQGIASIKNKTVDFGASDAPLSASEEAAMPAPVVHIPTVGGAVALTYNLAGVPAGLKLTPDVIADIFLGKITTWSDPRIKGINPGVNLPGSAIQPVHRTDGSGTTYIFTNYLKKANPEWASERGAGKSIDWGSVGLGGKGNEGVAAVLGRTPGGIGYVELAYAVAQKLPFAAVKNRAGQFILPSSESTTAAIGQYVKELRANIKTPTVDATGPKSYPICSLTYILLYKSATKPDVVKLWTWVMESAQQSQAASLYYAPLPAELVQLNLATLKTVK